MKNAMVITGSMCWKKFPGKKIKGLTNISYVPLPQCMTYCIGCKVCNAVSYDTATDPACWIQLAKDTSYLDQVSFESSATADSYILDKACLSQIEFLPKWLRMDWILLKLYIYIDPIVKCNKIKIFSLLIEFSFIFKGSLGADRKIIANFIKFNQ